MRERMLGYREQKNSLLAAMLLATSLCVLSSCASSSPDDSSANKDPAITDAMILDENTSVGATPVEDSSAFAGLEATNQPSSASAGAEGDTFYNAMGGETLRRVALTLYSDKSFTSRLMEKNPDLKGVAKLSAEQKVYFDMSSVQPNPRYLTKDLLDRYAAALAERIGGGSSGKSTTTIGAGESLQDVSKRLYGTSRYWTELYLVNHDKIKNYDRVPAGMELTVINRAGASVAAAAPPSPRLTQAPARTKTRDRSSEEAKAPPVVTPEVALPIQPEPIPEPSPTPIEQVTQAPPADPIPDTPPVAAHPAPAPAPVAPAPAVTATTPHEDALEPSSHNSNVRRILYIALILLIGGGAFYFTRTPKRPKMDMLDLNADATSRPKVPSKDSQHHNVG